MRYAIVVNGTVTQIGEGESVPIVNDGTIITSDTAQVGDRYMLQPNGTATFITPPKPQPAPQIMMTNIKLGDFLLRFLPTERISINRACFIDEEVADLWGVLKEFSTIDLNSDFLKTVMNKLNQINLLSVERSMIIMTPLPATPEEMWEIKRSKSFGQM
jgi:hypothetical protein